jgi:hypothetical protein
MHKPLKYFGTISLLLSCLLFQGQVPQTSNDTRTVGMWYEKVTNHFGFVNHFYFKKDTLLLNRYGLEDTVITDSMFIACPLHKITDSSFVSETPFGAYLYIVSSRDSLLHTYSAQDTYFMSVSSRITYLTQQWDDSKAHIMRCKLQDTATIGRWGVEDGVTRLYKENGKLKLVEYGIIKVEHPNIWKMRAKPHPLGTKLSVVGKPNKETLMSDTYFVMSKDSSLLYRYWRNEQFGNPEQRILDFRYDFDLDTLWYVH